MRRRLLDVIAAVSIVLCLATIALWIRSYFVEDGVSYWAPGSMSVRSRAWEAVSSRGGLGAWRTDIYRPSVDANLPPPVYVWRWNRTRPADQFGAFPSYDSGITHVNYNSVGQAADIIATRQLQFGDCFPAILFFLLPAIWIWRRYRTRFRSMPGHCPACGYDLRATPDRCPECGFARVQESAA